MTIETSFFIHYERSWRSLIHPFFDLLACFIDYSFLGRHANAILALLNDGGDRDPEILEQVCVLSVVHKSFLQLSSRSHMFCCFSGFHILVIYNDVLAKVSSERYCPNSEVSLHL